MAGTPIDGGRGSIAPFGGVRAFAGGIGFVLTTPSVWGWALVPAAVTALLALGTCGLSWWGAWEAGRAVAGDGTAGGWAVAVTLGLFGAMVAVLVALTLAQPCAGFALEAICRAQERALVGRASPPVPFWPSVRRNLKVVAATLVLGGGATAALFAVEVFAPPAAVVTVPLKVLVGGWLMAWNFLDYPLGLRGVGFRDGVRWVGRHFAEVTVFGLLWWSVVLFPGAVLLLLPMGVAGAARLVAEADGVPRGPRPGRGGAAR
jgi:CysZ protein